MRIWMPFPGPRSCFGAGASADCGSWAFPASAPHGWKQVACSYRTCAAAHVLCLAGETRALTTNAVGTYSVRSGPFMRKFLGGHFPMRVTLAAQWRGGAQHPKRRSLCARR